jgi:regulator of protease activity HflC (stomatin/prohibitin superfamily)
VEATVLVTPPLTPPTAPPDPPPFPPRQDPADSTAGIRSSSTATTTTTATTGAVNAVPVGRTDTAGEDAALGDTAVDLGAVAPGADAPGADAPGLPAPGLPAQGRTAAGQEPPAAAGDAPSERPGPCLPGWFAGLSVLSAATAAGWLLWHAGLLPQPEGSLGVLPRSPHTGTGLGLWSGLAVLAALAVFVLMGLTRGRPGSVWVLTRCGAYRGSVRRTGLLWISPMLRRQRIDVTLRHWRSRPIDAVDATGTPLQVTVLVVWRVRDSARAAFVVHDHIRFLRETIEAALARAFSRYPADDFRGPSPTLRDCDRLADELHRLVSDPLRPAGVEVFSATPVRIDYAPEVEPAMRRARMAALDARQRKAVLDDVLAAVADTVRGIRDRGLADLDDYERKALVRDLTVSLLTHPAGPAPARLP